MSRSDAYGDEVHSLRHISEQDADRLLVGDLPAGDPSLDELAAFVQDVGVAYTEPPTEHVRARHLDAMRRAARPRAAGWNPSAELDSAPGRKGPGLPERIGRGLAALTPRPAALAAVLAFCLGFTGLTALGALPDRVQAAAADAARAVGVTVPDPDAKTRPARERREERAPAPARPAAPRAHPTSPRRSSLAAPTKTGAQSAPQDQATDGWHDADPIQTPDPPADELY